MDIEKDVHNIINYSHKYAKNMLNTEKEYYPFGAKIDNNGDLIAVGYHDNETECPENKKAIEELTAVFERELNTGDIKAYALTYNVRLKTDHLKGKATAILIDIYHRHSNKIPKYYFTYSWNENDELIFGESFGIKKKNKISTSAQLVLQ
ncbi:hypothetical protein [Formosa sp. PL04]|uniref:hypothetical protein n=1 Tax=Formosa sp. PL04 TaxID=3081755 RepID=UPI0029825F00|nr:hypothetical protein [Formosa sp. PL04]MDW5290816.1 hypothetical protein [Formosa sp. PL04]